ncbi:MAG: Dna2/Cas4 domain-containing protein [Flavobacteriales bacterium]|nr:Dna2/Cas4 domain-containing protein [Flavobacteriales bacterium]
MNNERGILLPSGETYQPDRVVKKAGQTYILDYKTGQKEKHHEKQLLNYQSILLQMGYQNVSSYLLYLKDKELVAVN